MAETQPLRSARHPDEHRATLVDRAPDAVFTVDREGAVVELNQAAEHMFGYARAEALGQPLADLIIPAELRARHWSGLLRLAAGGTPRILDRRVALEGQHRDGRRLPVEIMVTRTSEEPPRFTGFIRDLSASEPTEDADERSRRLAVAAERFELLGAWEADVDATEIHWSEAMFGIYGVDPESFRPTRENVLSFIHPEQRAAAEELFTSISDARDRVSGSDVEYELRIIRPDGGVRELTVRARLIRDADDRPLRWLGTTHDVTEQRSVERALRAHDAVAAALRDWVTFEEGIVRLLERVAEALDLSLGVMWTWDEDRQALTCRAFHAAAGVDADDAELVSRRAATPPGHAIAGRAWAEEAAVVVADLPAEITGVAAEQAAAVGARSGVAFPAMTDEGPLAVLAFYGTEVGAPGAPLAESLASIGSELGGFLARHRAAMGPQQLSPREIEVLQCAAEGNIGREIADLLVVSPATVKTHFENIYEKLGVSDRAAAVAHGLRLGLIR